MNGKLLLIALLGIVLAGCVGTQAPASPTPAPALSAVERGKALFSDPSLGTSGSTCKTCHPSPEASMKGVGKKYPAYFALAKRDMTLKQVINFCIENPLKGKALPENDEKLLALEAYLKSIDGTPTAPAYK